MMKWIEMERSEVKLIRIIVSDDPFGNERRRIQ